MSLLVLGPVEVRTADGGDVPVRRGRPRRLLLALLLRRGGAVPSDTLVEELWGDDLPGDAANALQILVSYLRRTLVPAGIGIERSGHGYRLVVPAEDVDLVRVEALVERAQRATAPAERVALAEAALALWRGPALAEVRDDGFAAGEVARVDELRLAALECHGAAMLEAGRHAQVLPDLARRVRDHPFREGLHSQLVLALYRSGRQAEALGVIGAARDLLAEELGLDASPALRRLEERILRQDPALDPPPMLDASPPDPSPPDPSPPDSSPPDPATPDRYAGGPALRDPAPVPVALTPLVGREDLVDAVLGRLDGTRLVTLSGPGGAGKTRVAAAVADRRPEPVWWADLAGVEEGGLVGAAVAGAAGLPVGAADDPGEVVARAVAASERLLVLDTAEHVAPAVRDLVGALLARCPRLRVLGTSRRPLGLPGETVHPVPPLQVPDLAAAALDDVAPSPAVRLFCQRAAAARPGFALTAANAADVARICRLLDGLPLAVELAAVHVRALSPARIALLLEDRLRLVGGPTRADSSGSPPRPGVDRHAGLRAVVDWSYELLAPAERTLLVRLSVFRSPFPLEAAVSVAGPGLPGDALELLLALVRQSLVVALDDDRFVLLDTVRAFAQELLDDAENDAAATRDRHAAWCADLAAQADRGIRGPDQAGWLRDLRAAQPDLRAALAHALSPRGDAATGVATAASLSWFWSFEGAFGEARRWLAHALPAAAALGDGAALARLRLADGMHAVSLGHLEEGAGACAAAADAFGARGDTRGEAEALLHLGVARWGQGRAEEAARAQDEALRLLRDGPDWDLGLAEVLRARTALDQGRPGEAAALLARALPRLSRAGDRHLLGLAFEQLARAALDEGADGDALEYARQALACHEAVGYPEGAVAARLVLAEVLPRAGGEVEAAALAAAAVRDALAMGALGAVADGLEVLARAVVDEDPSRAARLLGRAEAVRDEHGIAPTRGQRRRGQEWVPGLRAALGNAWARESALGRALPTEDVVGEPAGPARRPAPL